MKKLLRVEMETLIVKEFWVERQDGAMLLLAA
jgi:hypothetical protein